MLLKLFWNKNYKKIKIFKFCCLDFWPFLLCIFIFLSSGRARYLFYLLVENYTTCFRSFQQILWQASLPSNLRIFPLSFGHRCKQKLFMLKRYPGRSASEGWNAKPSSFSPLVTLAPPSPHLPHPHTICFWRTSWIWCCRGERMRRHKRQSALGTWGKWIIDISEAQRACWALSSWPCEIPSQLSIWCGSHFKPVINSNL